MVRQTHDGLETLLLKRSNELKHMPGLWVFPGGKVEASDEGDDDLEQARRGAARELQEEAGLSLPAETLLTFSHWLTPVVVKRRFATWFFIAEVGSDEPVTVDGSEIVAHEWWRPGTRFALTTRVSFPLRRLRWCRCTICRVRMILGAACAAG